MSLVFNDTTNFRGLVQLYERILGFNQGDVSGNAARLKQFAADVNLAWDDYLTIALPASGTWQFDDSNQTDYPIIRTNIVQGQQDYSFLTDASNNLILDIFRARILPSATAVNYVDLDPVDDPSDHTYNWESTTQAIPSAYDKLANAIRFNCPPSYAAPNGLELHVNREPSYFSPADTAKKPGCPGIHHAYFAIKAAYRYASSNSMPVAGGRLRNGAFTGLLFEIDDMEKAIETYFARRNRDEAHKMTMKRVPYL